MLDADSSVEEHRRLQEHLSLRNSSNQTLNSNTISPHLYDSYVFQEFTIILLLPFFVKKKMMMLVMNKARQGSKIIDLYTKCS
jgi:hypothetical protein